MRKEKPRFSLAIKILYAVLVILILMMFWPSTRMLLQQGLARLGLFRAPVQEMQHPAAASPPKDESSKNEKDNAPHPVPESAKFTRSDGKTIDTKDLQGKVVFLNFWATWCAPCVAEMPSIQTLSDQLQEEQDVLFILVEVDGDIGAARYFMKQHGLSLTAYVAASDIPRSWLSNAIPSTVVLNKAGNRVYRHQGQADYSNPQFVNYLKKLAAE